MSRFADMIEKIAILTPHAEITWRLVDVSEFRAIGKHVWVAHLMFCNPVGNDWQTLSVTGPSGEDCLRRLLEQLETR